MSFIFFIAAVLFVSSISTPCSDKVVYSDFVVEPFDSSSDIADKLAAEKIIKNRMSFKILVFISGKSVFLKSGVYRLSPSMTPVFILRTLLKGREGERVNLER